MISRNLRKTFHWFKIDRRDSHTVDLNYKYNP